jgi:predicted nucleotide-binding protein
MAAGANKFFHVRILKKNREASYGLNLTEEIVIDISDRFNSDKNILFQSESISPYDIDSIGISVTSDSSNTIIKKKREQEGFFRIKGGDINNFIFEKGEIVTSKYIKDDKRTKKIGNIFSPQTDILGEPKYNVFIVHGHEEALVFQLHEFVTRLHLKPCILKLEPEGGKAIIEKFEKHAKTVKYAFVILTPDDVGGEKPKEGDQPSLKPRARQNVILELGYFYGVLGRNKVCGIIKGDIEKPSDIDGILFVKVREALEDIKFKIQEELVAAEILDDPHPL